MKGTQERTPNKTPQTWEGIVREFFPPEEGWRVVEKHKNEKAN